MHILFDLDGTLTNPKEGIIKSIAFALRAFDLGEYFASVNGSELNGVRSNKAELIAYIIEQQAIEPANAIMVGDRSHDIAHDIVEAIANNVKAAGVLWDYSAKLELVQAKAAQLFKAPGNLPDIIDRDQQD